jgi:hypothetical protein
MQNHVDKHCPHVEVECDFEDCSETIKRADIEKHRN